MTKTEMKDIVVLKMVDDYIVMTKYEGEWYEAEDVLEAIDTIHDMIEPTIITDEKNKVIYSEDAQDYWEDEDEDEEFA